MMFIALLLFSAGPLDEIDAARAARDAVGDGKKLRPPTTVYVSFLGTSKEEFEDQEVAFLLALNSVSFRRQPIIPIKVLGKSETLYEIDAEALEWKEEAVQRLLLKEPYFYPIAPDVRIIRADWFVKEATFGNTYYDLLDFGKTLADIEKRLGFQTKSDAVKRAQHGGRVVESGVSPNPRVMTRLGNTPFGPYWITDDIAAGENENILQNIEKLRYGKPDAHELFGSLPNGLYWWALSNAAGQLQEVAPIAIAEDTRKFVPGGKIKNVVDERPSRRVEIQNAHSCLGCHAMGLRDGTDVVSKMITEQRLDLRATDRKTQNAIEDFFDAKSQSTAIRNDSAAFVAAMERLPARVGLKKTSLEIGNIFAIMRWKYADALVSKAQAALELNVDLKTFEEALKASDDTRLQLAYWFLERGEKGNSRAILGLSNTQFELFRAGKPVAYGSNTLRILNSEQPIPRAIWEKESKDGSPPGYLEAALLVCYHKRKLDIIAAEQVRARLEAEKQPVDAETATKKDAAATKKTTIKYDDARKPSRPRQENMQWNDGTFGAGEWDGQRWVKVQ